MSDEIDVFAQCMKPTQPQPAPKPVAQSGSQSTSAAQPHNAAKPQKKAFHAGRKSFARPQKQNSSPIRGANGTESVNPLLNAPLPTEQNVQQVEQPANPNRDPSLPEYRLADIQTWPAQQIVDCMMPGADPEELGTYRKHELSV